MNFTGKTLDTISGIAQALVILWLCLDVWRLERRIQRLGDQQTLGALDGGEFSLNISVSRTEKGEAQ